VPIPFFLNIAARSLILLRLEAFRNSDGFAIASFIVNAHENHLARPVAGGNVLSGALKSQVVN